MLMLSELLRHGVIDRHGRRARLDDLALAVLDADYPPVTGIYFSEGGKRRCLDWDNVLEIRKKVQIVVRDIKLAHDAADEPGKGEVLLKRDVMDALIIDLLNRRTTRANDLQLEEDQGKLRLKAVDAGMGAMLRRISHGLIGSLNKASLFDWQHVEFLRGDPKAVENGAGYHLRVGRLPAGGIAQLSDYLPYLHAAELLKLLPDEKAADVLQAMRIERQVQVIEELGDDQACGLLQRMSPDLAADLVAWLPANRMKKWLGRLPEENSSLIIDLLRYPENSVGGVMINNMICLAANLTASEARAKISESLERTDFTSLIFVVDNDDARLLRGTVLLRDLLAADKDQKLEDLMDPYLSALCPFDSAREAAHRIVGEQLKAMPVIEDKGRLIGAMTINAAIAQIMPSSHEMHALRAF